MGVDRRAPDAGGLELGAQQGLHGANRLLDEGDVVLRRRDVASESGIPTAQRLAGERRGGEAVRIEDEEAILPIGVVRRIDQIVEGPVVGEILRILAAAMHGDHERQAVAAGFGEDPLDPVGPADGNEQPELAQEAIVNELVGHRLSSPFETGGAFERPQYSRTT